MPKGIKGFIKGHTVSKPTRRKIGLANRGTWIKYECNNCGKENEKQQSKFNKSKTHFCNRDCFKAYVKRLPPQQQNAYKGIRKKGESKQVYHRRYVATHKERISHLKAKRYARQRNAEGSHTLEDWEELKRRHNYKCVLCRKRKKLTKDHIIPLSEVGTDYISNIQPLCRNCNSQKWKHRTRLF